MLLLLPRFDPRRAVLAGAALAPPVLVAALANTLMALELATLDFSGLLDDPAAYVDRVAAFKASVELTNVTFFVVFGLLTVAALHMTQDAMKGLHAFSLVTVVFLGYAVYADWTFNVGSVREARLGMGIAFWGLGWVLIVLHLFSLLRATPHRKWGWVTGAVGVFQAAVFFLALEMALWIDLEITALIFAVVAGLAGLVTLSNRQEIGELWGYGQRTDVKLPDVDRKRLLLVFLYAATLFGLIGAEYAHHFSYEPTFRIPHYVLLAAITPVGTVLYGLLAERAGRRTLLYAVPLNVGVAFLVLEGLQMPVLLVIAEGLLLGSLPFLFQYLAESVKVLSRGTIFLLSMGAVGAMGFGGSFIAQFRAWTALSAEQVLLVEFAGVILTLVLAPQLPETRPQVTEEEELEDYLELAKRVQSQN